MATEVLMPKLGLTMTEGTIEEWKFKEGDTVKKGDILFSVATDKLTNDIEADTDGVLLKILLSEGETADCKSVIAYIGAAGETIPRAASAAQEMSQTDAPPKASAQMVTACCGEFVRATPYARKLAMEKGYDLASIKATGPNGIVVAKDVKSYVAGPKCSPMAAKLADELGVDMAALEVQGRVMKRDVLAAANTAAVKASYEELKEELEAESNDEKPVKVNPLRRAIASNMVTSWTTSPRVTFTYAVDVTEMKALRARLKEPMKAKGIKITYNHILMKVVATALTEFPDLNASFKDNMLTHHKHVNMGLAVAKGDGLIVPNVKSADTKSLAQIAQETEVLIEATRDGKIAMEDMTGGTFTISSLGAFGVRNFSPIINQPELAILGVCDMVDTPVVFNGEIVIRPMMNLCLTADHRVVDGVQACKFMQRIVELLENPYLLLA